MFWDKIAGVYDLFETVYNRKAYRRLGIEVAREIEVPDIVLECACGTGTISKSVAEKCTKLIATDLSEKMLKRAKKKCKKLSNVQFVRTDIMHLPYEDGIFDKVIAGNVIHLLDDPHSALKELERVCRMGGKIIIPTYINVKREGKVNLSVRAIDKAGASFKRQFTFESYQEFFKEAGCTHVLFNVIEGKMPCAIAVITKT